MVFEEVEVCNCLFLDKINEGCFSSSICFLFLWGFFVILYYKKKRKVFVFTKVVKMLKAFTSNIKAQL